MIIHTADLHIGTFGNRQLRYARIDALEEITLVEGLRELLQIFSDKDKL